MKHKDLGKYSRRHREELETIVLTPKEFHNPYKSVGKIDTPDDAKKRKVRTLMAKRQAPNEKAYTWSMGYNNLVGRYSPGGKYSRLTGSSLNRNPQLSINFNGKDLQGATDYLIKMARALAKKMSDRYADIIHPITGKKGGYIDEIMQGFCDLIVRPSKKSAREFGNWLRTLQTRELFAYSFGVHLLSARSRGKIKDKATAFFRAAPGSRTFCTLTFVAAVDDKTAITILNKFLVQLRKQFSDLQFLWVAERQKENIKFPGNIHFHMLLNKRLPVGRWNAMWVLQQYNSGLIGEDRYGDRVEKKTIEEAYAIDASNGFKCSKKKPTEVQKIFNPFDIRKVHGISGLSNYLTKYITKQEHNEPFGCATWHCSRRVSRMFTRTTVGPGAFAYMKSFANFKVDRKTGECWQAKEITGAFFVNVYANDKKAPLRYLRELEQINKWILTGLDIDKIPWTDDDGYTRNFTCKN
jgi:hypothetical protein